jgi:hypothetical protein
MASIPTAESRTEAVSRQTRRCTIFEKSIGMVVLKSNGYPIQKTPGPEAQKTGHVAGTTSLYAKV